MNKRLTITAAAVLFCLSALADLVPEILTLACYRTNSVATSSSASTYFTGTRIRLTNSVAYAANGARQDLTGCGVFIRIGDNATNVQTTGAAMLATNGTFTSDALIPATGGTKMRVQLRLTNGATLYVYPSYEIAVQVPL